MDWILGFKGPEVLKNLTSIGRGKYVQFYLRRRTHFQHVDLYKIQRPGVFWGLEPRIETNHFYRQSCFTGIAMLHDGIVTLTRCHNMQMPHEDYSHVLRLHNVYTEHRRESALGIRPD
ncbi:hypothetical protein M758_10G118100 [Ceratodon purpureus]|nr:hypothetical protein M758_10G118100 [Ceratodon purpureus]